MSMLVRGTAFAAAVAIAGSLGGCQSTRVVQALPEADLPRLGVGNVVVEYKMDDGAMQSNMSSEFKQNLEAQIAHATKQCGGGELTRDVKVSISRYRRANPAMTMLVGDTNQLHGSVYFADPASGGTVGTYEVVVAEGGGGLLGIAIMANGDAWLAREFSAKICSDVLKRKAPAEAAPNPAQSSGDAAQAN